MFIILLYFILLDFFLLISHHAPPTPPTACPSIFKTKNKQENNLTVETVVFNSVAYNTLFCPKSVT